MTRPRRSPGRRPLCVGALARGADTSFDVRPIARSRCADRRPSRSDPSRSTRPMSRSSSASGSSSSGCARRRSPRAPLLLAHLAAIGFTRTPTPYAAVFRGEELVAMVTAFLPEALDGWDWCVDASGPPGVGGGRPRSSRLSSGASPRSCTRRWRPRRPSSASRCGRADSAGDGRARRGCGARRRKRGRTDDEALLRTIEPISPPRSSRPDVLVVPVIHPHGDLHVGQVLRWRDGYAVIDFDGNPTVDRTAGAGGPRHRSAAHEPAARGEIADRRSQAPARRCRGLGAAAAEAAAGRLPGRAVASGAGRPVDERLLRAYEVEQECRELIYAARFLPRWRYAPMGVLRGWYRGVA